MALNFKTLAHGSTEYLAEVDLRNAILRRPLGLSFSAEELAEEVDSFHLAGYLDNKLVCCLVLKPLSDSEIQMRQVAVNPDLQGQGIGRALVEFSEQFALEHGFRRMLMHARTTAITFYERLEYTKRGEEFLEVSIPHFEMYKDLG